MMEWESQDKGINYLLAQQLLRFPELEATKMESRDLSNQFLALSQAVISSQQAAAGQLERSGILFSGEYSFHNVLAYHLLPLGNESSVYGSVLCVASVSI